MRVSRRLPVIVNEPLEEAIRLLRESSAAGRFVRVLRSLRKAK